jgi:hypothetical protein
MKVYGGADTWTHVFLTSELVRGEWSASRPSRFVPGERAPRYPLNNRLGGPRSRYGRDQEVKILDSTWTRTPIPLSLYRVHYPGSSYKRNL